MNLFSSKIKFPAGVPLGGYSIRKSVTSKSGELEINGICIKDCITKNESYTFCSVDTLYPGSLSRLSIPDNNFVIAATHTHYAPMLDTNKPKLGRVVPEYLKHYQQALVGAKKTLVSSPDRCFVYRAEVDGPVYRRFDYPDSLLNKCLSKYGGSFPNQSYPIDKSLKIFVFTEQKRPLFAVIYHACHPVSRSDINELSADYVKAIRDSVRSRFKVATCLFFLGCAGDIRPNFARKRVEWLPRNRLNWRFNYSPDLEMQKLFDHNYCDAVISAKIVDRINLKKNAFRTSYKVVNINGFAQIEVPFLEIGRELSFVFLPFEVSHRYNIDVQKCFPEKHYYIVSCAGDTYGYLPHPTQFNYSGYEVDNSRGVMNLKNRVSFNVEELWEQE